MSSNLALTIKKENPVTYNTVTNISGDLEYGNWIELSGQFVHQENNHFIYIAGVDPGVDFYIDDISLSKLSSAVNPEDIDDDGLLDVWEQNSFGSLDSLPTEDNDNDGSSNLLEYRSGTDPNNMFSVFRNFIFTHNDNIDEVQWLGSTDKEYRVLSTNDLETGEWEVLAEGLKGDTSSINTWTELNSDGLSKFYKIEIDD